MTDKEVLAELSDFHVLALTLWGEARGEELEGRVAVGCVIRNRVIVPQFPDTIKDVCLQPWQFSCWRPEGGGENYRLVISLAHRLTENDAVKSTIPTDAIWLETLWLTEGLMNGIVRDRIGGANHYLTRTLWETAPPKWTQGQRPVAFVQRHVFFKL